LSNLSKAPKLIEIGSYPLVQEKPTEIKLSHKIKGDAKKLTKRRFGKTEMD
jgi:hypothetical protein